jgi:monothiol glutaredoxin
MFETGELEKKLGDLVVTAKAPALTVTKRAAKELSAALAEASPGDVIHLTITPSWEHQLDMGAKEDKHITVETAGIALQLDRASAGRAEGVSIDFVEDANGAGFKIDNPNRPPMVREVPAKELKALLDAGKLAELYDVRTPRERELAVIPGSKLFDDAAMASIDALPRETPIAFHCHHGGRSRAAAEHFLKAGFKTVYNLAGGIDAWSQQVDPSVKRY